ncbi:MAG: HAD family phosphatase [Tissierellia bacterium]|nr:HAD family phosphatase [Tissierellia bacterium]
MDYKLIAIDMDGTLLNSKQELSKRNIDAINAAKKKGVNVVLSTGRMLSSAQAYAKELGLDDYIIACNGAVIMDGFDGIIHRQSIDLDKVEKMMDIGKYYDIYYHFYDTKTMYSTNYVKEIVAFYNNRDLGIDFRVLSDIKDIYKIDNLSAYKFIFIDNDINKLKSLKGDLVEIPEVNVTRSWVNNIEVMDKDASKGSSLEFLCNKLNISKEEVIAIGDNENDLSMIKYAGLGVAMENAEDEVLKKADFVTKTNDDDGVAEVIDKFILKRG